MAESFGATLVYAEDWRNVVQERLNEPVKWKDICNVEYTDMRLLHNPYLTDPTVQTGVRGSSYTMQNILETDDNVTFNTFKILPQFIDRADMAQSTFLSQMNMADRQATLLNEAIESGVYAYVSSASVNGSTDFDNSTIGGSAGSITVSATNIDDIIRAVKRKIRKASGQTLLERNGGFIVWRPEDLEILEGFMQANGFVAADAALQGDGPGTNRGVPYMGLTHYSSNLLTNQCLVAGVKKAIHLGVLKDTYGQIMVNDKDPGQVSGISVVSRVDFGVKIWNNMKPVVYRIDVV